LNEPRDYRHRFNATNNVSGHFARMKNWSFGMQNNPLVSVVMTAWNRESFIGESIASILGQTYGNLELIIIDDGSTDSTDVVVESFKDSRIRFFRRPHLGIVSSANFGIAQA
jgi:glycosyltransferase involved in cell wall biosynthesis